MNTLEQVRRFLEYAMGAMESKEYDHAWSCMNQAMHRIAQEQKTGMYAAAPSEGADRG